MSSVTKRFNENLHNYRVKTSFLYRAGCLDAFNDAPDFEIPDRNGSYSYFLGYAYNMAKCKKALLIDLVSGAKHK